MLFAACLIAAVPQTWTVDGSGNGDFFDLPQAAFFASDGDVLRFAPGTYTATTLSKDLTLVGSGYLSSQAVTIQAGALGLVVDGAVDLTLANMHVERLTLKNLSGRVRIDHCAGADWWVQGCPDVVMTRNSVRAGSTSTALTLMDSGVTFQDGAILGGTHPFSGEGRTALATLGIVDVQLIGSEVLGGDTGPTNFGSPNPGPAVAVSGGMTRLIVRGSVGDDMRGGQSPAMSAPTLKVWAGTLDTVWSGANVISPPQPAVTPAEPYLKLSQSDPIAPGRKLSVFGPPNSVCLVAMAVGTRTVQASPFQGNAIRLDLSLQLAQVFVTLKGQNTPANFNFTPPGGAALVGFEADVQGLVAMPNGTLFVTNATQLILTD